MSDYVFLGSERRVIYIERRDEPPVEPGWVEVFSLPDWEANTGKLLHLTEGGAYQWIDPRTLEQAKAARVAAMRDAREAALAGWFTWDGSAFDSDQVAQTRLMGLYVASQAQAFEPAGWRLADNTWRVLDAEDTAAVWGALQAHIRATFAQFAAREAAIAAAQTNADIDFITWEDQEP